MTFVFHLFFVVFFSCNDAGETRANKSLNINRVSIAYDECGKKDTTLLFIHGWCINKEYWNQQSAHFCSNYKVITLDLPGFGNSGKNRTEWSFEQYAEDIKEFISAKELTNVILIGHSMSGDILLLADTRFPEKLIGIIGIDNLQNPESKYTEEQIKQNETFFSGLETNYKSTVDAFTRQYLFPAAADSTSVNRVIRDFKSNDSVIAVKVLRSVSKVAQREKVLMQQLTHKLYLVNSDMYPTQLDTLKKYCKSSVHVEYINGTGHYPMIESPAAFNRTLEKVIQLIGKE